MILHSKLAIFNSSNPFLNKSLTLYFVRLIKHWEYLLVFFFLWTNNSSVSFLEKILVYVQIFAN